MGKKSYVCNVLYGFYKWLTTCCLFGSAYKSIQNLGVVLPGTALFCFLFLCVISFHWFIL